MLRVRVIPALLLRHRSLVKTRRFRGTDYVGDPCNTLRIFNELEVDELAVLDIAATREKRGPDFELLADIASECFMPVSYGGGIRTTEHAARIFQTGFEKVILNSVTHERPDLVTDIANIYGSQAVVAAIDVRRRFGVQRVTSHSGRRLHRADPADWAKEMQRRGAGEVLLTDVDREGTWSGFDLDLVRRVSDAVEIPVIAQGGAGGVPDLVEAVRKGGASSVAVGSMVVYQRKDFGVLVNYPEPATLAEAFGG